MRLNVIILYFSFSHSSPSQVTVFLFMLFFSLVSFLIFIFYFISALFQWTIIFDSFSLILGYTSFQYSTLDILLTISNFVTSQLILIKVN